MPSLVCSRLVSMECVYNNKITIIIAVVLYCLYVWSCFLLQVRLAYSCEVIYFTTFIAVLPECWTLSLAVVFSTPPTLLYLSSGSILSLYELESQFRLGGLDKWISQYFILRCCYFISSTYVYSSCQSQVSFFQ